jgi:hypothetical protein
MSGDEATKWNGYSVDEFREIFTDTKRIEKILTVPELKMLAVHVPLNKLLASQRLNASRK